MSNLIFNHLIGVMTGMIAAIVVLLVAVAVLSVVVADLIRQRRTQPWASASRRPPGLR